MADQKNQPSDAQLLSRLRRRTKPATAKDLGVPASRLRALDGVQVVGSVKTGRAGRPALLFSLSDTESIRSGAASQQTLPNREDDDEE